MTDAAHRTATDDDALLKRLRALAWGPEDAHPASRCLPDRPFPPLTGTEVDLAERALAYPLPELLRRVYTEVGDGGVGPEGASRH
ncbi:hypothetical protein OHR86_12370 [Streptomyces sp. NBC_00441]|uniref:hypothetical protein n=1 Tax=Streptomyces sp. NBC_00441 TaxID=2975742 RepID=UPI002E2B64FB|nr:hypothetical protein [Streptomyces sp. NBC_00441]